MRVSSNKRHQLERAISDSRRTSNDHLQLSELLPSLSSACRHNFHLRMNITYIDRLIDRALTIVISGNPEETRRALNDIDKYRLRNIKRALH